MKEKTKVFNLIVLDASGSMNSIKEAVLSNFNELCDNIKGTAEQFPNQEHSMSFVLFNFLEIKNLYIDEPVDQLPKLTEDSYTPNALTPLYDAMGQAFTEIERLQDKATNAHVIASVITDGLENASREYSFEQLKKFITRLKAKRWEITYYGANHDVEEVSKTLNINVGVAFEASEEGLMEVQEKTNEISMLYCKKI